MTDLEIETDQVMIVTTETDQAKGIEIDITETDYRSDYRESRDYKYRDRDYDRPRNYDRTRSSRSPDKVHVMTDVLNTLTDTLNY